MLHQGAVDIGQGSNTVIAQIFADALGVPLGDVRLVGADTAITPDAGKTSASRQTFISGKAAEKAAHALRDKILRFANVSPKATLSFEPGLVVVREGEAVRRIDLAVLPADGEGYVFSAAETYDPPTLPLDEKGQGKPYAVYGWGAQIAELEVDMKLGTVRLIKITAAHDVGKAINPLLVEGQIEGGIAQGIGMALMEEYIPGRTENLARLSDPDDRRRAADRVHSCRSTRSGRTVRGEGVRRACADPHRAGDPQRHPPRDRRAGDEGAGDADPRAGGDQAKEGCGPMSELSERFETHEAGEKQVAEKIRCDACPVMCYIADGRSGACDRYGNIAGRIVRLDPLTILEQHAGTGEAVAFEAGLAGGGELVNTGQRFVTAIGAGTTYPDYKPAPFIVSQEVEGVDLVTVVTEGIFSYCGVKVKIDTDRHIGPEAATVRSAGEAVGHVTTGEYGSQMLSLGGVHHLTGGSKAEGRVTCDTMLNLCNKNPVELSIDGGATVVVQAGKPPVIDGKPEHRMRVGCGSATIGMFAAQWRGLVDEVVVVDDHITGVVSEHQAGKVLGWEDTGIKIIGRRSTPGRYFKVSEPGLGWGGTTISDPLSILGEWNPKKGAKAGMSLLMVSTTGEQFAYYELDETLKPVEKPFPERLRKSVELIEENCEPALCTVLFVGGAGGSLRAGVVENPVRLTRSVQGLQTYVTVGGAPVYVWPGGGITLMVDVMRVPDNAFGYVPTPALVAPIEFTLRRDDYVALGGHAQEIRSVDDVIATGGEFLNPRRETGASHANPWPPLAQLHRWEGRAA